MVECCKPGWTIVVIKIHKDFTQMSNTQLDQSLCGPVCNRVMFNFNFVDISVHSMTLNFKSADSESDSDSDDDNNVVGNKNAKLDDNEETYL